MTLSEKRIAILAISPIWIFFATFVLQLCSYALIQAPTLSLILVAFLSATILPSILFKERSFKFAWIAINDSFYLILACFFSSSFILDSSFDGQTYHQLAVSLLEKGWNFYSTDITPLLKLKVEYQLPLRHYPKFPWLIESLLYGITGDIEGAKSLNLVFLVCSGLLAYLAAIGLKLSRLVSIIFALALSLNPVSICQLWTFYVDGLLASITLFFFAALSLYFSSQKTIWANIAGIALIILIHIKFTALVIVGSLFLILFLAALRSSINSLKLLKILSGYLFFGAIILGWHPYVSNLLSTGNPIYPVAGYSPIGRTPPPKDWPIFPLVQGQQPEALRNLPGPLKTTLSLFSRVADPINPNEEYNYFWNSKLSDFSRFTAPDLRLGGFGPLFAVVLAISLLGLFYIKTDELSIRTLCLVTIILLSSLLNPESWWARYSPQLWLLPLLLGMTSKNLVVFRGICLTLALSSIAILGVNTRAAYLNSLDIKNTLVSLTKFRKSSLPGNLENYYANELRLNQLDIKLTAPDNCTDKVYFAGSPSYVCLKN